MRKLFASILILFAVITALPQPVMSAGSDIVVVTPKGKKYHRMGCRTVRKSYRQLTVLQAQKGGYKPCKVCDPPLSPITSTPNDNFEVYGN